MSKANKIKEKIIETLTGRKKGEKAPIYLRELSPEGIPYCDIKDHNGYRYMIPGLHTGMPDYLTKYASYMYMKYHNPELFEKIMSWD